MLACLEDPGQLGPLKEQLRPDDQRLLLGLFEGMIPNLRGEYAQRLSDMMRTLGVMENQIRELQHRKWWRRANACKILAWIRDPRVIESLEKAMDDPNGDVRLEAATALVKLGAVRSPSLLLAKLAEATLTRSLAVIDLCRTLGPSCVAEFIAMLDGGFPDRVMTLAVDALGFSGDLRVVEPLLKLQQHSSAEVRFAAVQALGALGDPRALAVFDKSLHDPAWEVRAQTAFWLGRLGASEMLSQLQDSLDDDQWWVRYRAAEALAAMGNAGAAALRALVEDVRPRVAEIAQGVLNEKGLAT
jgi:HEAT repeat protein